MRGETFFLQGFAFKTFFLELPVQTVAGDVCSCPRPRAVCQCPGWTAGLNAIRCLQGFLLKQESAIPGSLPAFVNKVLLQHRHAHLFLY